MDSQKVALLLHTGGADFQELYYTLIPEDEEKGLKESFEVLDNYFVPKVNVPFERHLFRQMSQAAGETVDQFVCRLRQKALTCEFANVDETIRDQLIEKCGNVKLCRKFLEKVNASLKDLQDIARAHEAVEIQMRSLEQFDSQQTGDGQVNVIDQFGRKNKRGNRDGVHGNNVSGRYGRGRCFNCNRTGHFAKDTICPARDEKCNECGIRGHFSVCCRKKNSKVPQERNQERDESRKKKAYQVDEEDNQRTREEYAFVVEEGQSSAGEITLMVGGVQLDGVLIDSGASCNVIGYETWSNLKKKNINCQSTKSAKKLFAYGQKEPIEVAGTFVAEIVCEASGEKSVDEFTVIKGAGKPLLGKSTAEKLKVLHVGPLNGLQVCSIATEGSDMDIRQEYADLFVGVGKLKNYQLKLHINKDVKPVAQGVRRLPFGLRDKVDGKLDDLLAKDIIEEVPNSPTEWVSPLVVVPKPDGDVRVCIDMRKANEAIVRERHPIPTIEEILYDLNGATVFSKLDLKWGFHQIELEEQSRDITTFVTHRGLYRYKRLMFGITSAPEKYQKIISDVIRGCEGVAHIADDLIVYGGDLQEHERNLHAVLQRLKDSGMTLNGDKCQFRLPKLTFFGHELSNQGVTPSEEKIAAVVNARAPRNISEVRSFVQLVQYSAKFIPNFSQEAEPLRKLLRQGHPFVWGIEQQRAFDKLKQLMSTSKSLAYFRNDCKTRIIADAGPEGLGAVLLQLHGEEWRAISYASRNLTEVERRYAQTEKEALALVWACERFNLYVYGREFELETDHKPLQCIFGKSSKPSARIERWVLRLQCHRYNVVYRPGNTNIADALSRLNQPKPKDLSSETEEMIRFVVQESTPVALTPREIERESDKDPELASIRHFIQTGDWSNCKMPSYLCVKNELCVMGKLVLRGDRIVIPRSLRETVLKSAHEGHQGIVKTKSRLRTKVWWPKLDVDAEKMCKSCSGCQVVGQFSPPEPMMRTEPPMGPWQDIAIDLMGPMPTGESLLVVVDYYSRFYEVVIMRSTTTQKVTVALSDIFARFGFPHSLKSDNGPQFVSEEFRRYLLENGIEHRKSPPLWPQANGEVERQNRTLLKALKVAEAEGKKWQEELPKFLLAYRSTPQVSTGATPAYLMFGRELKTKLPELRRQDSFQNEEIKERDWGQKLNQKAYADYNNKASTSPVVPGDQVLLKNTKTTGKLAPNYEKEPYTVVTKQGHELMLKSKNGEVYRRDSSFVKPFNPPDEMELPSATGQNSVNLSEKPLDTDTEHVRPKRATKLPDKFKDYVMEKTI
jgi:transposase InsO family protein